jgi:hypothetical protein
MIAAQLIDEVRRLLATKTHSQRRIARLVGLSRGTIAAIAAGRRRETTPCKDDVDPPSGPPTRCPGCGGLVYMPCRLCGLRSRKAHAVARGTADVSFPLLALDLRPEHRARYEQVRARRRRLAAEGTAPSLTRAVGPRLAPRPLDPRPPTRGVERNSFRSSGTEERNEFRSTSRVLKRLSNGETL